MQFHALRMEPGSPAFEYSAPWDAKQVYGCECDETWSGYDCSQRRWRRVSGQRARVWVPPIKRYHLMPQECAPWVTIQ